MRIILTSLLVLLSLIAFPSWSNDADLKRLYESQQSDTQVQGIGEVIRVLPDDNQGSRHQKFILRLDNRQTILIAHNIDLAPRILNLNVGDIVEFNGEYEFNSKGGVVHWTHHDPSNYHEHGWLKRQGQIYN